MQFSQEQVQKEVARLEQNPPGPTDVSLATRLLKRQRAEKGEKWQDLDINFEDVKLYMALRNLKGGTNPRVTPGMMETFKKQDLVRSSR